LKKKSPTEEAGSSSDKVERSQKSPMASESEEEEEHQLQRTKRPFPGCPKLPDEAIFSGKTINNILFAPFIHEVPDQESQNQCVPTTVSPTKLINPQPILALRSWRTLICHLEAPKGQSSQSGLRDFKR
jgi:hypothetical protein